MRQQDYKTDPMLHFFLTLAEKYDDEQHILYITKILKIYILCLYETLKKNLIFFIIQGFDFSIMLFP